MAGSGTNAGFYFLKPDGRWYRVGQSAPAASLTLRASEGYYYFHSGTGFVWRAGE